MPRGRTASVEICHGNDARVNGAGLRRRNPPPKEKPIRPRKSALAQALSRSIAVNAFLAWRRTLRSPTRKVGLNASADEREHF
jgi:hypothetical protein